MEDKGAGWEKHSRERDKLMLPTLLMSERRMSGAKLEFGKRWKGRVGRHQIVSRS